MQPSQHIDEPTGRVVDDYGHRDYRYDDPALPPERAATAVRRYGGTAVRPLNATISSFSTCAGTNAANPL